MTQGSRPAEVSGQQSILRVLGCTSSRSVAVFGRFSYGDIFIVEYTISYSLTYQGSPTSRPQTSTSCQISAGIKLEIKCTINVMHLSHPETTLFPVHGKIVFHETGSWCQKWLGTTGCINSFFLFVCFFKERLRAI